MPSRLAIAACAAVLITSASGLASDRPVVIELFTSQGCSSCPPGDAHLAELAKRDDILALGLHVDYWDYLGWKDSFASRAHSERQRGYATRYGWRHVYTPQMIVNGIDHAAGGRVRDIAAIIADHKAAQHASPYGRIMLMTKRDGDMLSVTADAVSGLEGTLTALIAHYHPGTTVQIQRGENAGRTLGYSNVVTSVRRIGEWMPSEPLEIETTLASDLPAVVLIQQDGGRGPIRAAIRVPPS